MNSSLGIVGADFLKCDSELNLLRRQHSHSRSPERQEFYGSL